MLVSIALLKYFMCMAELKAVEGQVVTEAASQPKPAYFLSLSVENVRCFRTEQTLDISDGNGRPSRWTIILGNNGVGKTTLLQCLAGMQPTPQVIENPKGPSLTFVPRVFTKFPLRDSWHLLRQSENTPSRFVSKVALGARLVDTTSPTREVAMQTAFQQNNTSCSSVQTQDDVAGLVCYGYGASRRLSATSLSESKQDDGCASLFDESIGLINAEEWLLQADYAAAKALTDSALPDIARKRRDDIVGILVKILPDISDIKIESPKDGKGLPLVTVKTPYGWVPLRRLSSGYRSLLAWIVDLASRMYDRYPGSSDPLAEPAVVLIDQIDLHLHPKWQRDLMTFLAERFPNTQFIVTAHSPLFVQAALGANISVLRRDGDHVVIDKNPENIRGWRIDQIYTSDLFGLEGTRDRNTEDLLNMRRTILAKPKLSDQDVESLADLESQLDHLPMGETRADSEAMELIRSAARRLREQQPKNDKNR